MSLFDAIAPAASLIIAVATVVFTTLMLSRQVRQMEHERNALAIIEAIDRLSSPHMVQTFAQLRGVLEQLSESDRLILTFRYALDYTTEEIADILDINSTAVHMRLSRARQRLAERLEAEGVGYAP